MLPWSASEYGFGESVRQVGCGIICDLYFGKEKSMAENDTIVSIGNKLDLVLKILRKQFPTAEETRLDDPISITQAVAIAENPSVTFQLDPVARVFHFWRNIGGMGLSKLPDRPWDGT